MPTEHGTVIQFHIVPQYVDTTKVSGLTDAANDALHNALMGTGYISTIIQKQTFVDDEDTQSPQRQACEIIGKIVPEHLDSQASLTYLSPAAEDHVRRVLMARPEVDDIYDWRASTL